MLNRRLIVEKHVGNIVRHRLQPRDEPLDWMLLIWSVRKYQRGRRCKIDTSTHSAPGKAKLCFGSTELTFQLANTDT